MDHVDEHRLKLFNHDRLFLAFDLPELCLDFVKYASNEANIGSRGQVANEGWKTRVIKVAGLVGFLSKHIDSPAEAHLEWQDDLGALLVYLTLYDTHALR